MGYQFLIDLYARYLAMLSDGKRKLILFAR